MLDERLEDDELEDDEGGDSATLGSAPVAAKPARVRTLDLTRPAAVPSAASALRSPGGILFLEAARGLSGAGALGTATVAPVVEGGGG